MPGTRCAVAICNNSLQHTKAKNLNISYHTFPKDVKLQQIWINACGRKDPWNPKTSVICSSHFNEEDFETNLRASLMNIKTRRMLKPSAVPSRNCRKHESRSSTPRKEHHRKALGETLLLAKMEVASSDNLENETAQDETGQNNLDEPLENTQDQYKSLENRYRRLKQGYNEQQKKIDLLNQQLSEISKKYEDSCKSDEDMEMF